MAAFHGTKHDDVFDEASDTESDTFFLFHGGNDTVLAGSGNDVIKMGASLNAADRINGGDGRDTVVLHGDYSAGLTLAADTITDVEVLRLTKGFSYNLTLADDNVSQGAYLTVNARALEAGQTLTFDGSHESNGHLIVAGGAGGDLLTGGRRADFFDLSAGGNDTVHAGTGNDRILMGDTLTSADAIDGGTGDDIVTLDGSQGALHFTATTMVNVATLQLLADAYDITTDDATVAMGATMTVDAGALTGTDTLTFDGSAETNGKFILIGGGGDDHIVGGKLGDSMTGGGGADIFAYTSAAQSTGAAYDTITDFAAGTDTFDLTSTVTQVYSASGALDGGTHFNSELAALNLMHAGGATELTVTGGTLAGHVFLVVDGDGNARYDAGHDYVIDVTGHTGTLTTGDFI
jgi:Ca2+-binding RTX toxin-like protein